MLRNKYKCVVGTFSCVCVAICVGTVNEKTGLGGCVAHFLARYEKKNQGGWFGLGGQNDTRK